MESFCAVHSVQRNGDAVQKGSVQYTIDLGAVYCTLLRGHLEPSVTLEVAGFNLGQSSQGHLTPEPGVIHVGRLHILMSWV